MSPTPSNDGSITPVSIYGRTYHLRGNEDGNYLTELARVVDGKMREAADATGTADTLKVAILAALNIADEYLQVGNPRTPATDRGSEATLARMITLLDEALAD